MELAYDREEISRLNGVGSLSFSLPGDDPKAAACAPFGFVRTEEGTFYRLLLDGEARGDTGERTFTAEHAIATLVDDLMFGAHIVGGKGIRTKDVLGYILARQTTARWRLGACDFAKEFEYGFESENLLNALQSVPNLFTDAYRWEYDMRDYPWTVSLRRLDAAAPRFHIRAGKNLISASGARSGVEVCTRLYLLGYGEGDNQLTIAEVNGGKPYLQSPQAYIDQYGLISKVYVDRQFEDAQSLMERGRALLTAIQEPRWARTFQVADLYPLTGQEIDNARVGDTALLGEDGSTAYITGVRRRYDEPGDMALELATTPADIAADIAEIAQRQRIEQVYAQGATQVYAVSVQANATTSVAAVLNFRIPQEMRIINKVVARISLERFRSYSQVTSAAGKSTQTSSSGGGAQTTSSSGGGAQATSSSGGGTTRTTSSAGSAQLSSAQTVTLDSGVGFTTDASSLTTTEAAHPSYSRETGSASGSTSSASASATGSAAGGSTSNASGSTGSASSSFTGSSGASGTAHTHSMLHTHSLGTHSHSAPAHTHSMLHTHGLGSHTHPVGGHRHHMSHTHSMWHQHRIPGHTHVMGAHSHSLTVPGHTHQVTVPAHSHSVSVPGHSHSVTVPAHSHQIVQGIFRSGNPSAAKILVNGQEKTTMTTDRVVDVTPYLMNPAGKIPRESWFRLGVLPNDDAYVTIDLMVQGFVQSRGGGSY